MIDKPLRILQVLRAPIGGLFRHVNDLTRALAERGHVIGIVADSLTSDELTETRLGALERFAKLGIHRFPIPRTFGARDLTTPLKVRALARRLKIDVVHGHGAKGGVNARLVRMGTTKRVAFYTPHGGVLNFHAASKAGKTFRLTERVLLGSTDAIIFESAYAQGAFARLVAQPSCPGPVIHNGLAPGEFEPLVPAAMLYDFVYVGEFRELKGIDFLLDALSKLKTPEGRPASLIMAGGGPDVERVRSRVAAMGMSERVLLAGTQPARFMFARGRCAVVPSLAESLPYVVLEAAAAGLPVIATDVGGVGEIFGPTANSLVPAANSEALAVAMAGFLNDPVGAAAEAQARLAFIKAGFSIAHMTDQIETLYYERLAARAGR